ncbi:ATP-dependent DNA helicase RecG [Patescibacteria group bacterium]|nr:ATP-dependent DNA helicase RecG [Patescibacteria group bacterium]
MLTWTDPLSYVHGLTPQQRRVLKKLDVETVSELLSILPRRYDDYSNIFPIVNIPIGESVTIKCRIKDLKKLPTFRKRFVIIRGVVEDDTGSIVITWFNQPWMLQQLKIGDEIFVSGTVRQHPKFGRGFTSPIWEPATEETLAAGNIAPVYPLMGQVTQKTLRKIMKIVLDDLDEILDPLPKGLVRSAHQPDFFEAIKFVHKPEIIEHTETGRQRFVFNEVLLYQLAMRMAKNLADQGGAPKIKFDENFAKKFTKGLPFELTPDQKRAVWAAAQDMEKEKPMRRLVQGDVGSGKTVVAAFCVALVHRAGFSAALMAPTEILAKQHAITLQRFLGAYHIPVLLMTSSTRILFENGEETKLKLSEAKQRLKQGRVVAVGTHALIQPEQCPPDLGLAVVDEQHRFGVAQREALTVIQRPDSLVPHLLSMTATPIPRSLALTFLGDLDVSIIKTKPAGRKPIKTNLLVGDSGRKMAYQAIRNAIIRKEQAFIVCPLIDPSDKLGMRSVEEEKKRLSFGELRGLKLSTLHGKMGAAEKDVAMNEFKDGKADVLIATTVVEVGVDIPNATIMCIESAERFGLAQLHQLRGRIGRSDKDCSCFLIATDDSVALNRLRVLEQTNDGFIIAEEDLKIRGQGNVLGLQQSGKSPFKYLRPADDLQIMKLGRDLALELMEKDPELASVPILRDMANEIRQTAHGE